MNVRKLLIFINAVLVFLLFALIITTFIKSGEEIKWTLIKVDLYLFELILITLLVAKFLPDMKYSYVLKNILGWLLILGMITQWISFPFQIRVGFALGSFIINFVVIMSVIGIILALKYA